MRKESQTLGGDTLQHDYVLDNNPGATFRADLNNALLAEVSNNSGSSAPATTYAYQLWVDTSTTPKKLKIRDSANASWIIIGSVDDANFGLLSLAGGTLTGALLAAVLSTVATPDIAFSGDADTGIYRAGANLLGLVANATELLRVDGVLGYVKLLGTAGFLAPSGTTAQRPTGVNGMMRFNSDTSSFEGYAGTWKGLGGGGGGAGFKWNPISGTGPRADEENSEDVYFFQQGLAQELYASIKVPQSYSSGTQIKLYVSAYSTSSSNNFSMLAQSTLIRANNDSFASTTNQRTTTNAALTNTVASQLREVVLDITDSSGQINSVAVSAGDVIKVRLYRANGDTDTADVRVIANGTDVKFS